MLMIDKLAYSSQLRYKSPFLKSALAVGTLAICVAARSFVVSAVVLIVMGCLTVYYSRTSLSRYMKLMTVPLTFLMLGTLAIAFDIADYPLSAFNIAIGSWYLGASYSSLLYAASLIMVSLASVSCLYFLSLTTPMLDLLMVLRRLHCPDLLVELMMLIYRYIFVLLDLASAIAISQNCRLGNRDIKTGIKSSGLLFSVLLVRSLDKAGKLYDAMESRCFDGRIVVLEESCRSTNLERAAVAILLTALAAVAVFCATWQGL